MTCEEVREWVSADLDDERRERQPDVLRHHLMQCAGCRQFRTVSVELRTKLSQAECRSAGAEDRDEAIVAMLRREGLAGTERGSGARGVARLLRGPAFPAWQSARVSLAALTAALLLTWSSLRWAETCPSGMPHTVSRGSGVLPGEMPDTTLLDRWMAGPPTLGALSRLRQEAGSGPLAISPARRSAAPVRPPRTG